MVTLLKNFIKSPKPSYPWPVSNPSTSSSPKNPVHRTCWTFSTFSLSFLASFDSASRIVSVISKPGTFPGRCSVSFHENRENTALVGLSALSAAWLPSAIIEVLSERIKIRDFFFWKADDFSVILRGLWDFRCLRVHRCEFTSLWVS